MSLTTIQDRLSQTNIYLRRTRLILYLFVFLTAIVSVLFYIVALLYHAKTLAKDPTYILYVHRDLHFLCFVIIIPLIWSVVWSFIILRGRLKAIYQIYLIDINQNQGDDRPSSSTTLRPTINGSSIKYPITVLVIELFLPLSLTIFGYWFGFRYSDYFSTFAVSKSSHVCPNRSFDDPIRLGFFCTTGYKQILALETTAFITLVMNTLIHLLLFVITSVDSILMYWAGDKRQREEWKEETKEKKREWWC